jgi:hypothetical protein
MKFGAARDAEAIAGEQSESERFAFFCLDGRVIEPKLDWATERNEPARHRGTIADKGRQW